MTLEPPDLSTNLESRLDELGHDAVRPAPPPAPFIAAVRRRRATFTVSRAAYVLAVAAVIALAVLTAMSGRRAAPRIVPEAPVAAAPTPAPTLTALRRDLQSDLMSLKSAATAEPTDPIHIGDRAGKAVAKLLSPD